jgi:hypothetical protein
MNSGLQQGLIVGQSSGPKSGLRQGLQSGFTMTNRLNSLNPASITEPKLKPIFHINADNVALVSGAVSIAYNLTETTPNQLLPKYETIFDQFAGTTYRPPLVVGGLNGRNYMNFADTGNRYLSSATSVNAYMYANEALGLRASGTGMTYMFVIKRKQGGTFTIFDGRDSSTLATTGDLLLEVNAAGRITFTYCGGNSGTVTTLNGTAGVNLLNEWSIVTVKCQLRIDGGKIPTDNELPGVVGTKRYTMPSDSRNGNVSSAIDIFVNGVEQQKTITSGTFANADWYSDGSYRMLDRDIWIGNKGSVFATSGTHIASAMMIPAYIDKAYQQRLENYFRNYYSLPF